MLRTFRILRPLRSLRATPTLRQIVEALLGSIPGIINVLILQIMFFVLFAVLGLQVRFRIKCGGLMFVNRTCYRCCFCLGTSLSAARWQRTLLPRRVPFPVHYVSSGPPHVLIQR